jgi:Holliday junction resolvase-like predicted endonuclease
MYYKVMASFLSQKFNVRSLAVQGELLARQYYEVRGYSIIAANLTNSKGKRISEIDFVALGPGSIHFVEVKTRRSKTDRFGGGRYAVDYFKQKKLRKFVYFFLLKHPFHRDLRPQIDICLVEANSLDKADFSVTILPNAVTDSTR